MNLPLDTPSIGVAIQTLNSSGFVQTQVDRRPGYALIFASRFDEFFIEQNYCFAIAENGDLNDAQTSAIATAARHHNAHTVFVSRTGSAADRHEWSRFLAILGGSVFDEDPFSERFREQLIELGKNSLPSDMKGKPDDLFEAHVRTALQFMFGVKVIRYGQDRAFEAKPDGIVVNQPQFAALYDAKAYSNGYSVERISVRQFEEYVTDFNQRYRQFIPRIHSFLVVSGNFQQGNAALENRSRDFIANCGVPLSFLNVTVLAEMLRMLANDPVVRRSVNWPRLFATPVVTAKLLADEITSIRKDRIVPTQIRKP